MVDFQNYPTYMACSTAFTPGATPQDVFAITGSATQNILILRFGITTIQTTAGVNSWFVAKRSTANSGGTSASCTAVPASSGFPAATATVLQYTANPTAGTLVGNIYSTLLSSPAAAGITSTGAKGLDLDFESQYGETLILRSASEVLSWNFNGAALPSGLSVMCWVQWCESSKT